MPPFLRIPTMISIGTVMDIRERITDATANIGSLNESVEKLNEIAIRLVMDANIFVIFAPYHNDITEVMPLSLLLTLSFLQDRKC